MRERSDNRKTLQLITVKSKKMQNILRDFARSSSVQRVKKREELTGVNWPRHDDLPPPEGVGVQADRGPGVHSHLVGALAQF